MHFFKVYQFASRIVYNQPFLLSLSHLPKIIMPDTGVSNCRTVIGWKQRSNVFPNSKFVHKFTLSVRTFLIIVRTFTLFVRPFPSFIHTFLPFRRTSSTSVRTFTPFSTTFTLFACTFLPSVFPFSA